MKENYESESSFFFLFTGTKLIDLIFFFTFFGCNKSRMQLGEEAEGFGLTRRQTSSSLFALWLIVRCETLRRKINVLRVPMKQTSLHTKCLEIS
jgi:hypothetical protein